MGQAQQKRRAVLIVEDDAELRSLMAALFDWCRPNPFSATPYGSGYTWSGPKR